MIEIFLTFTLISVIIATGAICWARGLKTLNNLQAERIGELKAENRDLWAKLLAKSGNTPLGWENKPKAEKQNDVIVKPTVAHRGMMEARHNQEAEAQPKTNIHADRVSFERVKRQAVEKAGEIIDATK